MLAVRYLRHTHDWDWQQGTGQGAILNQDSLPNSAGNPAPHGRVVQIFATGLGATNPQVPNGSPVPSLPPAVVTSAVTEEGKRAVKMTRLSCHRFQSNEVQLWLSVMAYNLGNLWRRIVLPLRIANWVLVAIS